MQTHHENIGELTSSEIVQILERGYVGHLGCHNKDELYVVPITYAFENGYILSHSQPGKKIQFMRKNPKVCLQVEEVRDYFHWNSVIVWGTYEELGNDEAACAMRVLIQKIACYEGIRNLHDLDTDLSAIFEQAVIFRINIERTSGRFEAHRPSIDEGSRYFY